MDINQQIKESVLKNTQSSETAIPIVETPAAETPVETPVVAPVVETPTPDVPPVSLEEKPEYIKKLTELSGGKHTFEKDEDVKGWFEKLDKYSDVEKELETRKSQDDYFKELESLIEEEHKRFDPVARFGSKENYAKVATVEQLGKQGSPLIAAKLVGSDLDKMSDLDVISLNHQFIAQNLVGKDLITKKLALEEVGYDVENVDWNNIELNELQEGKMALKAANIRKTIKSMVAEAEKNIPELPHPLQAIKQKVESRPKQEAERKEKWSTEYGQKIMDGIDKITYEDFNYTIEDAVKKELTDKFILEASRKGIEPNEANALRVIQAAKRYVRDNDFEKIVPSLLKAREAKLREEFQKEHGNLRPLNTDKVPNLPQGQNEAFQSAVKKQLNIK
jgi:hypothetical protein